MEARAAAPAGKEGEQGAPVPSVVVSDEKCCSRCAACVCARGSSERQNQERLRSRAASSAGGARGGGARAPAPREEGRGGKASGRADGAVADAASSC